MHVISIGYYRIWFNILEHSYYAVSTESIGCEMSWGFEWLHSHTGNYTGIVIASRMRFKYLIAYVRFKNDHLRDWTSGEG